MPDTKSIPSKDSTSLNKLSPQKLLAAWASGVAPAVLPVVCVLTVAALIAVYHPSEPVQSATVEGHPQNVERHSPQVAQAASVPAAKAMTSREPVTANAPGEPTPKELISTPAPTMVTGCLERTDATFRLKDTTGVDAPKSRSWKSGFLKKGSASIQIVDAPNRLKLADYVGQRVLVTGTLVDREMQVRSLRRVAASCAGSPGEIQKSSKAVS
jgi:hypothetical protein